LKKRLTVNLLRGWAFASRHVQALLMAGLTVYAICRYLPVASPLNEGGSNAWWFLAIDLATIPPYVIGGLRMVECSRSNEGRRSMYWQALWIAALAAPYVFVLVTENYFNVAAWLVIALFIVLPQLWKMVSRMVRRTRWYVRLRQRLVAYIDAINTEEQTRRSVGAVIRS
jgi:hypothetical protein